MDDLITTADAAKIAGVGVTSIKRWADQSLIRVQRTPGGHRRVVKSHLLQFLRRNETPAARGGGTSGGETSHLPVLPASGTAFDGAYWADLILASDVLSLQGTLLQARSRHGSWSSAADEVGLGLREIGQRWRQGTLGVLDEHVASERLSRALAFLADMMPRGPSDPVCLLACGPGEKHTLALGLLELCFRELGWTTLWVGSSTPMTELLTAISGGSVKLVALSASLHSQDREGLAQYADHLGSECERSGVTLVLGGQGAWPDTPRFGTRVHAFADLQKLQTRPA